jgi:hypothetical protein
MLLIREYQPHPRRLEAPTFGIRVPFYTEWLLFIVD